MTFYFLSMIFCVMGYFMFYIIFLFYLPMLIIEIIDFIIILSWMYMCEMWLYPSSLPSP